MKKWALWRCWGLVRYMYDLYVVTTDPTNYPTLTSKCSTNTGVDYSMVPAFYQVHPNLTSSRKLKFTKFEKTILQVFNGTA